LEEAGMSVDEDAFAAEMKAQKDRARSARAKSNYMGAAETVYNELSAELTTVFAGYDVAEVSDAKVIALVANDEVATGAQAGDSVAVFLDKTPFYAESGGQVGDHGVIKTANGLVEITDCVKVVGGKTAHMGKVVEGTIMADDVVTASIDMKHRMASSRNHSATHLLQKALRTVLGTHVEQSGSLVTADRLRFDFTHFSGMTAEEIKAVEKLVNDAIFASYDIEAEEMGIDAAREKGAMALFGEKYGDVVRVVDMGGFSIELCGGAHLKNTAQIGSFKIVSENGIAAGVRRIEALTGEGALAHYQAQEEEIRTLSALAKTSPDKLVARVEQILAEQKELAKELEKLKAKMAGGAADEMLSKKVDINGVAVLAAEVKDMDGNAMRTLGDQLKNKLGSGVIVLAGEAGGKVSLVVMATDDVVKKGAHAGNIIKAAAGVCGGGGGGRPNMAQAGGKDASKIGEALEKAKEVIAEQIK
ncbi:MAG: alanine--tRNA ligase, partial [Anaerotignum sp.]|nr:alanine--tRNA ligase [Anaerotignum sp.]